jgi:O-antigen ligase
LRLSKFPFENFLLICASGATIAVAPFAINAFSFSKLIVFTLLVSLTLFLALIFQFKSLATFEFSKTLLMSLGIMLLSLLVTVFLGSTSIRQVLLGTWGRNIGYLMYLSLFALFLLSWALDTKLLAIKFLSWISNLGGILSVYGILQINKVDFLDLGASVNTETNLLFLTFGNINFTSGFIAMSLTASLVRLLLKVRKKEGFTGFGLFLTLSISLQFFTLFQAKSSQGFVALAISLSTFSLLYFFLFVKNKKSRVIISIVIPIVLGLISLGAAGIGPFTNIVTSGSRSFQDRVFHWISAWQMFRDNPVFGIGIDSFGDWYREYRSVEAIQFRGTSSGFADNAHNIYLQLASTGGLVNIAPFLIILILIIWRSFSRIVDNSATPEFIGVFSVWLAYQAQAFVSIEQLGIASWGWLAAGILLNKNRGGSNPLRTNQKFSKPNTVIDRSESETQTFERSFGSLAILALSLFMATACVIVVIPAQLEEAQVKQRVINFGNLPDSRVQAESLFDLGLKAKDPDLRFIVISELLRAGFSEQALTIALNTSRDFPRSWEAWDAAAFIYENTSRKDQARYARIKQYQLDPLNPVLKEMFAENQG